MDSTLRLIATHPVDQLARTLEALLIVASAPLSVAELADASEDDPERVETALGLLRERYGERRSGIVLEQVAGGYAFRASRDASTRVRGCSSAPSSAGCRRRLSRRSPWSRISGPARGRKSRASGAWPPTQPWRASSSAG